MSNWPDWKDTEKRVEATFSNGDIVQGILRVDDFFFDGEEEIPLFEIHLDNGTVRSFADNNSWRFLP